MQWNVLTEYPILAGEETNNRDGRYTGTDYSPGERELSGEMPRDGGEKVRTDPPQKRKQDPEKSLFLYILPSFLWRSTDRKIADTLFEPARNLRRGGRNGRKAVWAGCGNGGAASQSPKAGH